MSVRHYYGLLVSALFLTALTVQARPRSDRGDYRTERPQVGVAYVSVADGDVSKYGESGDWTQLRAGDELVSGDTAATGRASRAEVQVAPGNFIRLSANTKLRVVQLGNRRFQFDLEVGHVVLSQASGATADIEIQAGDVTVIPLKRGIYRVELEDTGRTVVTVRKGEADVGTAGGFRTVKKGKTLTIYTDQDSERVRLAGAPRQDDFDEWNQRRDKVLDQDRGRRSSYWPSHIWGHYGYGYGHHGYGIGVGYGRYYYPRYYTSFRYSRFGGRRFHRGGARFRRGRRF